MKWAGGGDVGGGGGLVTAAGLEPVGSQPGALREMRLGMCKLGAARLAAASLPGLSPIPGRVLLEAASTGSKRECVLILLLRLSQNTVLAEDKGLR